MKKLSLMARITSGTDDLLVRLGLRKTHNLLATLELATLLEQLYTFKTLEDIALRYDRAGAFERTMLRHK